MCAKSSVIPKKTLSFALMFFLFMWLNYKIFIPVIKSNTSWFIDFTSELGFHDAEGAFGQMLVAMSLIETIITMIASLFLLKKYKNRA